MMKSKTQDPEARPFLVSSDRFKHFRNVSDVSIDSNVIAASMSENWAFLEPEHLAASAAPTRVPFSISGITENGYHPINESPSVCVSSLKTPVMSSKNAVSNTSLTSNKVQHAQPSANGSAPYVRLSGGQIGCSQPSPVSSCSSNAEQLSPNSFKHSIIPPPLTVSTTLATSTQNGVHLDPFTNGDAEHLLSKLPPIPPAGKPRAFTLPSPPVNPPTKKRPKGQQNALQTSLEGLPPPPSSASSLVLQQQQATLQHPLATPRMPSLFDDQFPPASPSAEVNTSNNSNTSDSSHDFSIPINRSYLKVDAQTSPMSQNPPVSTPIAEKSSLATATRPLPLPSILSTPASKASSLDRGTSGEIVRTQQRVRIQSGAKDDYSLTPTSRNQDGMAVAGEHIRGHRRSHSAPVQVQIIMAGPTGGTAPQPFKPDSPRFVCCAMHIATISRIVAYIELVFCIIAFIAIIAGGATAFSLPASGMIIGGVATILLMAIAAGLILLGLRRHSPSWLIPYLVVKGFQLGAVGIALFISILGLLGFTTLFGIVSANSGEPPYQPPADPYGPEPIDPSSSPDYGLSDYGIQGIGDENGDPAQKAVNNLTVVFASIFVCLLVVLGFMILFFVLVFKCYRYLRELLHYTQTVSDSAATLNLTPAVTYQVIPRESDGGTDIVIQGHGSHTAAAAALADTSFANSTTMINHSYSDPNCSNNHNSTENLVVSPHSTGASTFFVGSSMLLGGGGGSTMNGNLIGAGGSTSGMTITELENDSDKGGSVYKRLKD